MTLHNTTEFVKKGGIATGIGIVVLIILIVIVRVGLIVKDQIFPPKIQPPTFTYDKLPPLHFPAPNNPENTNFTYTLNYCQ